MGRRTVEITTLDKIKVLFVVCLQAAPVIQVVGSSGGLPR
jgi:hypothetical protein